ncbi:MAG: sulfotransferase family 2 domain-containing protein [Paracoccaceae bacterium]
MIISPGRRYIFAHIPKTGGTALSLALEARAMKDDILIGDTPKAKRRRARLKELQSAGRLWKHSTLADIDGLPLGAPLRDFFCFTLVRNPWDRMVSYYHWLQEQSFAHEAVGLAKALTFSQFLNHPQIGASLRAAPYRSYMIGPDGAEHCALYARIEHLSQDLAPLEAHLGFSLGKVARANASTRARDYRGYYSAADAEILAGITAPDIAQFGYEFG